MNKPKINYNKYLKGGFYNLEFIAKLAVKTGNTIQYNYDKDNKKFYQIKRQHNK